MEFYPKNKDFYVDLCGLGREALETGLLFHLQDRCSSGDWLQHAETPKHKIRLSNNDVFVQIQDAQYGDTFCDARNLHLKTTTALLVTVSDLEGNWHFEVRFNTMPNLDAEFIEDENGSFHVEIENIDDGEVQNCFDGSDGLKKLI